VLSRLPDGMTMTISRVVAATHSADLAIAVVAAQEHSASASEIVAEKTDTRGAASVVAFVVGSSTGSEELARQ
jgi:hypothetical protein